MTTLFPGFEKRKIRTAGATINLVIGGEGPPLLLLHGYPETQRHVAQGRAAARARPHRGVRRPARLRPIPPSRAASPTTRTTPSAPWRSIWWRRWRRSASSPSTSSATTAAAASPHRMARDHGRRVRSLARARHFAHVKMYQSTNLPFAKAYYHWFFLIQQSAAAGDDGGVDGREVIPRPHRPRPLEAQALRQARGGRVRARVPRPAHHPRHLRGLPRFGTIDLLHDKQETCERSSGMPVLAIWGRQA